MSDKAIWLAVFVSIPLYFLMGQSGSGGGPITGQWTLELQPRDGVQFSIHRSWEGHNEYSSSSS